MKVALVHYWLVGMRGGEQVIEALCEIYPEADIFTHVYEPAAVSEAIRRHSVRTTFIQRLPRATKHYQRYLPLMPLALEQLDLRGYDLVISSESGPAKGVLVRPDTLHVCYCHTPMRYLWNMYHDYRAGAGRATRWLMPGLTHYLRMWDYASAARVDHFLANSRTVAARIGKYYRRDATVLHPPVRTAAFQPSDAVEDYYLCLGQLVGYKRVDLAVDAFNESGRKLVVIGDGEQLAGLRKKARANVKILGPRPFDDVRQYLARCRALVFPGEEDFGIVPVEAMASGRPVIAYARGGALETMKPGATGLLFHEQTAGALNAAVERYEREADAFVPEHIRRHALTFDRAIFIEKFRLYISERLAERETIRGDC